MKVILAVAALFCCFYFGEGQIYSCPPVSPDQAGICVEDCNVDSDCTEPFMCCSNGCGHTCTSPTLTPYHPPPYVCPTPSAEVAGTCAQECNATSCASGYQCCSNGCGTSCVSICNLIGEGQTNQTLIGAYMPQCEETGHFSEVQCHSSTGYCWCVDPSNGKPTSELVRGEEPQCSCEYEGVRRAVGEVFTAADRFNHCLCSVTGVQCTEDRVYQSCPPVRGDTAGICVAECTLDSECSLDNKCCYTGCGYSCTAPDVVPYVPLPTVSYCPPTNQVPCALSGGSCQQSDEDEEEDGSESSDSEESSSTGFECDEGSSMCCENDCASSVCVYRTGLTPCSTAREIVLERNSSIGGFIPQCDSDGHFRAVQCEDHYCWCVAKHTGEPESDMVAFELLGSLPCTGCVYEGRKYGYMEKFPASDGCNTCTCFSGVVACTLVGCVVPEKERNLWDWWHSVLIYCVVAVVVLTLLVVVLLVAVVVTMKRNKFRHKRLKEAAVHFESDMDAVYFKHGQDLTSVELKVPVEDNGGEDHTHA